MIIPETWLLCTRTSSIACKRTDPTATHSATQMPVKHVPTADSHVGWSERHVIATTDVTQISSCLSAVQITC